MDEIERLSKALMNAQVELAVETSRRTSFR